MAKEFRRALDQQSLAQIVGLQQRLDESSRTNIGYPCNQDFDYGPMLPLLGVMMNNVGDPFAPSNMRCNTHEFEREVVEFFADLAEAPKEGPDSAWGYVTNGGTEGNLYGLYLAREICPEGIVYYGEDTHYSVAKILRLMGLRSIMIRRQDNGEIDWEDLEQTIALHRETAPILFLNAGTTMTGAIDRVDRAVEILKKLCIPRHYIHVDAALMGAVLPFCGQAPSWNFAESRVDSLSISGHKFIGSPIPCGVVLARKRLVEKIARAVEYVGALDTTIMGSRDPIAPLFMWQAIRQYGLEGLGSLAQECLSVAAYAEEKLREIGVEAWRNETSITVVFPRPSARIFAKWTLAPYGDIAHLIAVGHVSRGIIDEFVADMAADRAGDFKADEPTPPSADVGEFARNLRAMPLG